MQVNKINNINFKDNTLSRAMDSSNAILMLRDPQASVKFEHNKEIANNADTTSSNPIVSLGYKLYKTFNLMRNDDGSDVAEVTQQFRAIA